MKKLQRFPNGQKGSIIPWDDILCGSVWEINPLQEFDRKPESFRANAFSAAKARGLQVRTSVRGEMVYVQTTGKRQFRETPLESVT